MAAQRPQQQQQQQSRSDSAASAAGAMASGAGLDGGPRRRALASGVAVLAAHDEAARACLLRLVVRAGSLDEAADRELGVAHFVEHCGFRGTRTHENGTLHKFVEGLGSRFGADLNAKTGLTETVWMLNVPVDADLPDCRDRMLDSLKVLGEWAHSIRFSPEDVEAERKVILEEYRMKRGSAQRIKDTYWRKVLPRVGARLPIGTLDSINAIDSDTLKRFYADTYVPERICLVAVGNLSSVGGVEGLVELLDAHNVFDCDAWTARRMQGPEPSLRPPREPICLPERPTVSCVIHEKGLTSTTVSLETFVPLPFGLQGGSHGFLRREVIKRVFSSVLEARFRELSVRPGSQLSVDERGDELSHGPWLSAGVSCRLALHDTATECTSVSAQCHRRTAETQEADQVEHSVRALIREVVRLLSHCPSDAEVDFAKQKWRHVFLRKLQPGLSRDDRCAEICEDLVQNFILRERVPVLNYEYEAQCALDLLEPVPLAGSLGVDDDHTLTPINAKEVWEYACSVFGDFVHQRLSSATNTAVVLQGQHCGGFDDDKLAELVRNTLTEFHVTSATAPLRAWVFHAPQDSLEEIGQALLPLHFANVQRGPGTGRERQWRSVEMPKAQARTFVLSNGIRVCTKDTKDIYPGKLSFQAFALGGTASLNDAEGAAFSFLGSVLQASGLGLLSDLELNKVESKHSASVRLQQHWFHRGLGGSCTAERLELLLQMICARLLGIEKSIADQPKKVDLVAFERSHRIALDGLDNTAASDAPELRFAEEIRKVFIGDEEPILRPLTKETLLQVTPELVEQLYQEAFTRDPTEFTFCFCGDFSAAGQVDELGDLLEAYLGALLPSKSRRGAATKRWPCLPRQLQLGFPEEPIIHTFSHDAIVPSDVPGEGKDEDEARAMVMLAHKVSTGWSPDDELNTDLDVRLACQVAQIKLIESLRTDQHLIYTVNVDHSRNSLAPFGLVFTHMSCHAERADYVVQSALAEFEAIAHSDEEGPTQASVTEACRSVSKQMAEWHKRARGNNSYWLFWLLDAWKRYASGPGAGIAAVQQSQDAAVGWVDDNVERVADAELFGMRVEDSLARTPQVFRTIFKQRSALVMLPELKTKL